jgi:hypothetical protein
LIMPKALDLEAVSISLKRYERVSLTTIFIDSHNMSFLLFVCLLRQCSVLRACRGVAEGEAWLRVSRC